MTAILFDLDGTLIDSAPDIHAAVAQALAEEGAAPLSLAEVRSFIGNGVPVLIARVMEARGEGACPRRQADLEARFLRHYGAASATLTTVYPGVPAALLALQDRGHPLGLCTNKPEAAVHAILASFGLAPFFPVIIGGDSLPEHKPHPAPLRTALARLGARNGLFVGDSEVDAAAAKAAGLPLLLYTEGYRRAPLAEVPHRLAFSDYADLPGLVADLLI